MELPDPQVRTIRQRTGYSAVVLAAVILAILLSPALVYAATVEPPSSVSVIDMGATTANITWEIGAGATNTTIVCKREIAPANVTDGEVIYTGNGTSYLHSGLDLEMEKYYYSFWGWEAVNGYSATYASADVGGDGVLDTASSLDDASTALELFLSIMLNLSFVGIALWRRELFLYIIAGPISFGFGFYWGQISLIGGIGFACIGIYCWAMAARKYMART